MEGSVENRRELECSREAGEVGGQFEIENRKQMRVGFLNQGDVSKEQVVEAAKLKRRVFGRESRVGVAQQLRE